MGEARIATLNASTTRVPVAIHLTPLAYQILVDLQRRRQLRRGDVLDELLRTHGTDPDSARDAAA